MFVAPDGKYGPKLLYCTVCSAKTTKGTMMPPDVNLPHIIPYPTVTIHVQPTVDCYVTFEEAVLYNQESQVNLRLSRQSTT